MASDRVSLFISPPPTPNGPLHVGHLSGPYVAGDIAARAARAAGQRVVTVAGLDSHQNYVLTRAEADGVTGHEAARRYGDLVRAGLAAARVEYDLFTDPLADETYRVAVAGLLSELVESKAVVVEPTPLPTCAGCGRTLHHARVSGTCPTCGEGAGGGTCEGCSGFLTAFDLRDAVSSCCGAGVTRTVVRVPVLRLEDYREQLLSTWAQAVVPPRIRDLHQRMLAAGLPDVVLAYPTDWGIEWSLDETPLRVDVWAEMALGYLFAVGRHLTGTAPQGLDACLTAWDQVEGVWHFLGVDNTFYYSTMIPALLCAAGIPPGRLSGLVVNEFYRLDGAKFSTSRNHAIWAHEFLAEQDPAVVRAYLAWDRPDHYGTDFTLAGFDAFAGLLGRATAGDGPALPAGLAGAERERAERALRCTSFDLPLAVRAVLNAYADDPARAAEILGWITAGGPDR